MNFRFLILLALLAWLPTRYASGQCNDQLIGVSAELLDDFTYIKDIKVRMKKSKKGKLPFSHKYSVILNKGMKYRFISANAEEFDGQLVFKIYNTQNVMIMTNYSQSTGKVYEVVDYTCKASGQYYVEVSFLDGKEGCAVCVLGFKRKKSEYDQYLDN